MKNIFTLIVVLASFLASTATIQAQYAYFPAAGEISLDKTVHVHNLIKRHITTMKDENGKAFFESLIKTSPETAVLKKTLSFSEAETRFIPAATELNESLKQLMQFGVLDNNSTVYQNLKTKQSKSAFDVIGQNVLLEDSILPIKWKITNEYRTIAGYECRRANGVTLDSIYLVAFYTDQIPTASGPASTNGLPGMILGLAVPEQHYTLYATKVDIKNNLHIDDNVLGKKKAKALNRKELYDKLKLSIGTYISEKQFNLIMASMYL